MRPRHLVFIGIIAGLQACGEEDPVCTEVCEGTLEISFADGREEFDVDIQGTGFSVTASCPGEAYSGNVYGLGIACEDGTLFLFLEEADFPSELSFLVDGERWDETPEYDVSEQCQSACESGVILLD